MESALGCETFFFIISIKDHFLTALDEFVEVSFQLSVPFGACLLSFDMNFHHNNPSQSQRDLCVFF